MKLSPIAVVEMYIATLPDAELPGMAVFSTKGESLWISDEH